MSRAVIAVMAGLLCALAGIKHGAALKADAIRLQRWGYLLQHLSLLIQEGSMSIPEALCTAADGVHSPDQLLRHIALKLQDAPMLSLSDAAGQCCNECPERVLLLRMFTRLGQGTKESRLLALEHAAAEMKLLADTASARAEKDVRLWQTLGLTGGICLTILLL